MDVLDDNFAKPKETTLHRIQCLFDDLVVNAEQIEVILDNIEEAEKTENIVVDNLEDLYRNEFMLYMDNVSIYEDLMNLINLEPRTIENEFELARMKKEAAKLLKVGIVDV